MKKIQNIKIISLDLFRTIVDIGQTPDIIWQLFLKDKFSVELSGKYLKRIDEINSGRCDASAMGISNFKTVRTVLEETLTEFFAEINLDYSPKLAANVIMENHKLAGIFGDVKPFLQKTGGKYKVCLSTDADEDLIKNVNSIYHFDNLFVSETMQMYKLNPGFFQQVIGHYQLPPENVLHIGDSKYDIIAPKGLGIQTCWLNRRNVRWDDTVKPDFEVKSLLEIPDLLD
jgi:HAD superfamily hydrolase (TIGR01549 family)